MSLALLYFFFLYTGMVLQESFDEVSVPLNHHLSDSKSITIEVEYLTSFDARKETVFLIEDAFDLAFRGVEITDRLSGSFNFVLIRGRKSSKELSKWLGRNGDVNYAEAYSLLNQDQVVRDIEVVKKRLVGDQQVHLLGYSASGLTMLRYATMFPDQVRSILVFSPLLFEVQNNLSFWTYTNQIDKLNQEYSSKFIRDFAWYSSYDFEGFASQESRKLMELACLDFMKKKPFYPVPEANELNLAFQVRAFELSFGIKSQFSTSESPIFNALLQESGAFWDEYNRSSFSVFGINYDSGLDYSGKLTIIGSAFDLLVSQKSYDVLAEFFPNRTLILLNDAHSFARLQSSGLTSDLINAFISDGFDKKVKVYSDLEYQHLIYKKSDNRKFPIPKMF
ncbi:alpha/beta fold hydrolase [Algoriphagus vanfongensis]|uniref:alpha/beta fold hydrolase n=1 Tax=Algoriphagus vanfongensis TaxID=426371 RepID=UPI00047B9F44|nr:alpha/beta fold hydrolase [Algoriphagus vanfongensis]